MRMERSRSLRATRRFALFVGMVAFNSTYLLGQVGQPAPANPLRNAVADPVIQRDEGRPEGVPAPHARASDWDEDEEIVEAAVQRAAVAPMAFRLNLQLPISVENSVFGVHDVDGGMRLKMTLHDKLGLIKREYPDLKVLDLRRLEIAGLGDIKRFQDQVAALDAKHEETLWNGAGCQELLVELPKLQHRMHGIHFFGNQSLLTKTLRSIVTKNQLTAQEIPGVGPALNLPDSPPILNGGFAIMQVQLADGRKAIMLEHRQIQRQVPQVRLQLPAVARQQKQNPVLRSDDKYYAKLSQLIRDSLEPEIPLRDEQREPLLAMLRRTLKQGLLIPLHDPDVALSTLSHLPEKEYLTVLDAKQWKALQRRFEAAK
jgi:hypothetical protein